MLDVTTFCDYCQFERSRELKNIDFYLLIFSAAFKTVSFNPNL